MSDRDETRARLEREAVALRRNLRLRKDQARAREAAPASAPPVGPSRTAPLPPDDEPG